MLCCGGSGATEQIRPGRRTSRACGKDPSKNRRLRTMRLTVLQRLGIVASIIWAVSAGIYTHNADIERAESFAKFAYKVCADTKSLARDSDLSSCEQERAQNLKIWMNG